MADVTSRKKEAGREREHESFGKRLQFFDLSSPGDSSRVRWKVQLFHHGKCLRLAVMAQQLSALAPPVENPGSVLGIHVAANNSLEFQFQGI